MLKLRALEPEDLDQLYAIENDLDDWDRDQYISNEESNHSVSDRYISFLELKRTVRDRYISVKEIYPTVIFSCRNKPDYIILSEK